MYQIKLFLFIIIVKISYLSVMLLLAYQVESFLLIIIVDISYDKSDMIIITIIIITIIIILMIILPMFDVLPTAVGIKLDQ